MTKNFKFLLLTFLISLPFWWGMNILGESSENFFYWSEISKNPNYFTAQITLPVINPVQKEEVEKLDINAKSAISFFINKNGRDEVLFQKDTDKELPIASLTKLMTALVVLENYDLSRGIRISNEAVLQEEDLGQLEAGKFFRTEYLLYPLLIESSNDAAYALANDYNGMTSKSFAELMNLEAAKLNLNNTFYINPSGLDPENTKAITNYSTANDLVTLTETLLKKPLIWEILGISKYEDYGPELINTNKLLGEVPEIIGGKTGYTNRANGCMLLVLKAPKNGGYVVNVILGTYDRFGEMKKLINWVNQNYTW